MTRPVRKPAEIVEYKPKMPFAGTVKLFNETGLLILNHIITRTNIQNKIISK